MKPSLNALLERLSAASVPASASTPAVGMTDPTYVEKLASAVEFVVSSLEKSASVVVPDVEKGASVDSTVVSNASALLKERLKSKVANAEESRPVHKADDRAKLAAAILGRIQSMKTAAAAQEEVAIEDDAIPMGKAAPEVETAPVVSTKEEQSLDSLLAESMGQADGGSESPSQDEAKTASSCSSELPTKLMGRTEAKRLFKDRLLATSSKKEA